MGLVLQGEGLHAEARRESFVLYNNFGDNRIELEWKLFDQLPLLVDRLREHRPGKKKSEILTRARSEIQAMIERIENDNRYKYPAARVDVNAPLALIQVEMKAQVRALKWALGLVEHIGTSAA